MIRYLEGIAKLRVRRFLEDFWPNFDSFSWGNIRKLILSPEKESKIGSKSPKNRQNLNLQTPSKGVGFNRLAKMPVQIAKLSIKGTYSGETVLKVGRFTYSNTAAKHFTEFVKRGPNAGRLS